MLSQWQSSTSTVTIKYIHIISVTPQTVILGGIPPSITVWEVGVVICLCQSVKWYRLCWQSDFRHTEIEEFRDSALITGIWGLIWCHKIMVLRHETGMHSLSCYVCSYVSYTITGDTRNCCNDNLRCHQWRHANFRFLLTLGIVLPQTADAMTSLLVNERTAYKLNLCSYRLKGLRQRHSAWVIQRPD